MSSALHAEMGPFDPGGEEGVYEEEGALDGAEDELEGDADEAYAEDDDETTTGAVCTPAAAAAAAGP